MTTSADARVLPCPFCGGAPEILHIEDGENAGGSCVSCTQCLASSNVEFEFKENFISNWNRRTQKTVVVTRNMVAAAVDAYWDADPVHNDDDIHPMRAAIEAALAAEGKEK